MTYRKAAVHVDELEGVGADLDDVIHDGEQRRHGEGHGEQRRVAELTKPEHKLA